MTEGPATPVAIIGMGCRLPGGIDSPQLMWDALLRGDDLVTEVPPDRWDADEYYDPEPGVPGRSVSRWGAFLDDFAGFDFDFFGLAEREAIAIDPQHRLLLETSWEAAEHAGLDPRAMAGSATGVFLGLTLDDYALLTADAGAMEGPYGFTGTNFSMASGRIAYALDSQGPAVTVDTACSSSLLALHMACRSLHDGESDFALAGGATVLLEPRKVASASTQGMLSPTGRCHSFDVAADGFVVSEGCAVLLLKRLSDALQDGDRILAVVRGTAANQDGRTPNIATPSLSAQVSVYRAALAAAGIDASTVGLVEAHGTGTPVGDPIEYASLAKVYGTDSPCALGSVKSNFGHGQAASGVMGVMKAALALQHGVVPRNLHFSRLPDDLADIQTKLFVPEVTTPWPADGRDVRRAAVSSYGLSGTNVHAILEAAPVEHLSGTPAEHGTAASGMLPPLLFPLSSTSAEELRRTSRRLADWVAAHADNGASLPDVAYTLASRRAHRPVRTSVLASSFAELAAQLREVADGDVPYQAAVGRDDRGPVWVFSGQGSQWAGMGADLLATEQVFAAAIADVEPLIFRESGFSVTEAMTAPHTVSGGEQVQPTLFAMQVAMAATMLSYGVRPAAVIGHSMGEVAAAVVAGGLSIQDGVRVICRRARLMSRLVGIGAMASVELPAHQVLSELAAGEVTDVVLSIVASPTSAVVGGATQTIRELLAAWELRGVMAREVAIDVAAHSPQVEPILDDLAKELADLSPTAPDIPIYSATLYNPRANAKRDAGYWVDNLRHMVRFAAAVQAALEDGHRVFAELSPHPLLTHAVEQTATSFDMRVAALASVRREQPLRHGLRDLLADLHSAGAKVDFSVIAPRGRLVDAPLPTWTHRQLLLTRDGDRPQTQGVPSILVHPLLGAHVCLHEEPERHAWESDVGTATLPWLGDHRVHNIAAFPAAAYCEMALAAARAVIGEVSEVRDIRFEQMLLLDDETVLGAVASVDAPGVADFVVETHGGGERVRRAAATLHAADDDAVPAHDISVLLATHPNRLEGAQMRQWFDACGLQFGPAFTGLAVAHTGEGSPDTVLAEIGLPGAIRWQQAAYLVHPALLDACFQSIAAHPAVQKRAHGILPLAVGQLRCYGVVRTAQYCYTRITKADAVDVEADLDILDEHGAAVLTVRGLRMGISFADDQRGQGLRAERLLSIEWRHRNLPSDAFAEPGAWLLVSTSEAADLLTNMLGDALKLNGAQCTTMRWPTGADPAGPRRLGELLSAGITTRVVILAAPANGSADAQSAHRGRDCVNHLLRVFREISECPAEPARLYVITREAQTVLPDDVANLEQGGLRGLMRVVGAEYPRLRTTQIDVDAETEAECLAKQLLAESDEDETAWRNGEWFVARLGVDPLRPEERRTTVVNHEHDAMRMQIRSPGDLETMELIAFERIPPGPGQVEVQVVAASINFADVLVAYGRYPSFDGQSPQFGADFAGVVSAVGPDVTEHRVGDEVAGLSITGCWGNFITTDAALVVTLPPGVPASQAAAMPIAYATAWHGLHELARISPADKVLIHSATGGVGQAAIAIARAAGAEIFATAGSPVRRELLRDMGIDHVYDSRTTEFADLIRDDTGGYGVDIVLNSLPGAAQRAGLGLLTFGGRFVEIGKRDIYGDTRLGLFPFRRNLAFYGLDLALLTRTHPGRVRNLLQTVYKLAADGELPLPNTTHYPLADAATAIRVMSAAGHTGKVVLDIPRQGHSTVAVSPERAQVFRRDGAYIVTGGLGGIGIFLAEKMAAGGCGRIVLTSRSEPDADAEAVIERIRARGADIHVECADISDPQAADRVVTAATATGLALRGVLHAAAVIEDATLPNITGALLDHDWAPKVYGAWNLHAATATAPLDWFCVFSSAAALIGSPGQGAYAAANSWLDAFTHWRRAQGLPATAIAWGPWAEIGRATALASAGADAGIAPDEGAAALDALLRYDRAYTGYAPIAGTPWLNAFAPSSPFVEEFRSTGQTHTDTSKFRAELKTLPPDEWPARLRRLISDQLSLVLRRTIDPDRPLTEYGLDSLGNLELRTRIEAETGVRVVTTDLTTVRRLAEYLCDKLAAADGVAEGAACSLAQ